MFGRFRVQWRRILRRLLFVEDWYVWRQWVEKISSADFVMQGGLSTAGGSVTLGLIADLYEPETQHWPLCFIVLSSTIGTSIGGVIGGPIEHCKFPIAVKR
jgi:hypothetical protein